MKKKAQQKTTSQLQFLSFLSNTWLLYKCITFVVFKSGYRFVNPRLSFSRSALTFPQRLCAVRKESATEIQLTPGREEKKNDDKLVDLTKKRRVRTRRSERTSADEDGNVSLALVPIDPQNFPAS